MKLTIDLGAIAHAVRRWWHRITGAPYACDRCADCGKRLTSEEAHYYGRMCERCVGIEAEQWDRIARGQD